MAWNTPTTLAGQEHKKKEFVKFRRDVHSDLRWVSPGPLHKYPDLWQGGTLVESVGYYSTLDSMNLVGEHFLSCNPREIMVHFMDDGFGGGWGLQPEGKHGK